MAKFNHPFYQTQEWKACRNAYMSAVGGLCERCLERGLYEPAVIAHHKIHLTAENITDPTITLNPENLQALCRQCHGEVHTDRRYTVDEMGRVIV